MEQGHKVECNMNAILLALSILGQCHRHSYVPYGPQSQWGWDGSVYNQSGWGYRKLYGNGYYPPVVFLPLATFAPLPSPWNAAVADMRSARASRMRSLSPSTTSDLYSLTAEKDRLWGAVLDSEPTDKPAAYKEYRRAKQRLEMARIAASRELH